MVLVEINSASFLLEEAKSANYLSSNGELEKIRVGLFCWNGGKMGKAQKGAWPTMFSPRNTTNGKEFLKERDEKGKKRSGEQVREVCPCGILHSHHLLEGEFFGFLPPKLHLRVCTGEHSEAPKPNAAHQNSFICCWNTSGLAKNISAAIFSCRNQKLLIKTNCLGGKKWK